MGDAAIDAVGAVLHFVGAAAAPVHAAHPVIAAANAVGAAAIDAVGAGLHFVGAATAPVHAAHPVIAAAATAADGSRRSLTALWTGF